MELASKPVRCKCCGRQTTVPLGTHITQCPWCRATIQVHHNDPLIHAHNALSHAASKLKDVAHAASNNRNIMASTINNHPTSRTSSFLYPPQIRPLQSFIPPVLSARGRKKAVLCGVSYKGQKYKLDGSVNDVKRMRHFLVYRFGFPMDSILMLTEEEPDPYFPTKSNIRKALRWLVDGCQSGDSLVFHYSGHASKQFDYNNDEEDGYDEVLWPVDHQDKGTIVDDEINDTIVRSLPRGAKLHAIMDACHSGTILDLPFVCRMKSAGNYMWEDDGSFSSTYKGTNGGFALSFSACGDDQIAVDTTALSDDNAATGIMTYSFIKAVENESRLTYGRLLDLMRQTSRETASRCRLTKALRSPQEPQLSSSEKFEIYSTQFVL